MWERRAELRSMRFFAEQMGRTWMGGIGFGGTSPIDGRPLDEAGMFSKQLRGVLPLAIADIASARPFSPAAIARSAKSPFPIPRKVIVALVNSRTRKAVRDQKLDQLDLDAPVYAVQPPRTG